jgi:spermidine/putrescine transport system ATP-binding protein
MGEGHDRDDVIELRAIRKEFGSFVAVEHADFSIARGEFFSLLGPSGCGKTTLLKMIAGFEQPTSGEVVLEGQDVSNVAPHQRNVNTVFQQYALFPHMSVLDNVAFGLRAKRVAEADAITRAKEMLDIVKLGEFTHRRPNQLSGGQQQRVALARALVNMPSALLLDEPLAALDLKLREAMQLELKRIQREVGITFIFVTHDQHEALTMSDRIAVMSRGRVEQIGTPEEIYGKPSSVFVAGFIGSANLLPGAVAEGSESAVQLDAGGRLFVDSTGGAEAGAPVTVMIRPERLTAVTDAVEGRSVSGTVDNVIFEGSSIRLIVHLADQTELMATVDADDDLPPLHAGAPVTLTWAADAPFVLQGRSSVVGSTTTDVDEVQAALDGKDDATAATPSGADQRPRFDRRTLLIGGGVVAAGAVGALALSSVGGGSGKVGGVSDAGGEGSVGGGLGSGSSSLHVINWIEYIDLSEGSYKGTVDRFEEATGISTEYSETWNDNNENYGKDFVAYLEAGNRTPWDIAVPTYWLAARLKAKEWIAPLPFNLIPNYVNLDPSYLSVNWDPGAKFNLPWQAGVTGFAYNLKETGRELKSINELWDADFKGRIGLFTEMRDTLGLVMLGQGNDPSTPTEDAMAQALDEIERQTSSGQVRRFTGNDYLQDIQNGNFAACIAWSGDIAQSSNPDVRFVVPEEGGMSWFDTMVIPIGAANGVAAARWMNFVYDPVNAALITANVGYVSPVLGVRDELVKLGGDAAALADSSLLFPTDEDKARLHVFGEMADDVDQRITDRFITITGG